MLVQLWWRTILGYLDIWGAEELSPAPDQPLTFQHVMSFSYEWNCLESKIGRTWFRNGSLLRTVLRACLCLKNKTVPVWVVILQQWCRYSTPSSSQRLRGLSGSRVSIETPELCHSNLRGLPTYRRQYTVKLISLGYNQTLQLQCKLETWIDHLAWRWVSLKYRVNTDTSLDQHLLQDKCRNSPRAWCGSEGRGWDKCLVWDLGRRDRLTSTLCQQAANSSCKCFHLVVKIKSTQSPLHFPAGTHVIKIRT